MPSKTVLLFIAFWVVVCIVVIAVYTTAETQVGDRCRDAGYDSYQVEHGVTFCYRINADLTRTRIRFDELQDPQESQ